MSCTNHWHCDPSLAAHMCSSPDRGRPCPSCGAVVSPFTLTDDQIVESLKLDGHPKVSLQDAWFATSDEPDSPRKRDCRARVCEAINARAKAGR